MKQSLVFLLLVLAIGAPALSEGENSLADASEDGSGSLAPLTQMRSKRDGGRYRYYKGCKDDCNKRGDCKKQRSKRWYSRYACECNEGYSGSSCERSVCDDTRCKGGELQIVGNACQCNCRENCNKRGVCKTKKKSGKRNEYESKCECSAGYSGSRCERSVCDKVKCKKGVTHRVVGKTCQCDYCQNNPCGEHGTCELQAERYVCKCQVGYRGQHCLTKTCAGYGCGNGKCMEGLLTSYCACPSGWSGTHCQLSPCTDGSEDEDPITSIVSWLLREKKKAPAPTCVNGKKKVAADGKTCICECNSKQWHGTRCEKKRACDSTTCNNGGTCVPTNSTQGYRCDCKPGYSGDHCAQPTCTTYNCGSGVCNIDKNTSSPYCVCSTGWSGTNCQISPCDGAPTCVNGKHKLSANGSSCVCECDSKQWYGTRCENRRVCDSTTCSNGGTCVPTTSTQGYRCDCLPGYTGDHCTQPTCKTYNCGSGVCNIDKNTSSPYCICSTGWSGTNCQISPCDGAPTCVNGKRKLSANGSSCVCECDSKQWYGTRCENRRVCDSTTCSNGGTCVSTNSTQGYRCDCVPGYTGDHCTQPTCATYNCGSGVCNIDKNTSSPYCVCSTGWSGTNCQISPCAGAPTCVNGKHKLSGNGSSCACECDSKQWYGTRCENRRVCDSTTCSNGGTCVPTNSTQGYRCDCVPGYIGDHCTQSTCTMYNCGSGVCNIDKNTSSPYCVCSTGWSGTNCQISPCAGAPTCVNGKHKLSGNGSSCVCECDSTQWYGTRCEKKKNVCKSTTCSNGGTCLPTNSAQGYRCDCVPGYTGDHCTQPTCATFNCGSGVCDIDKYTDTPYCVCSPGWSGTNCQIAPCAAFNCGSGVCDIDKYTDTPYCVCPAGWSGTHCQIAP